MPTIDFKEKYIERIPESGCWIWMGQLRRLGYGYYRVGNKKIKSITAHRGFYEVYKGKFDKTLNVLHRCDVRCCVNPNHLWLGTHTDNIRDMHNKGRAKNQRGIHNGNYKHGKNILTRD